MVNFYLVILVNEKNQVEKRQTFLPFLCHCDLPMTPGDVLKKPLLQHGVQREDELPIKQPGDNGALEATALQRL